MLSVFFNGIRSSRCKGHSSFDCECYAMREERPNVVLILNERQNFTGDERTHSGHVTPQERQRDG